MRSSPVGPRAPQASQAVPSASGTSHSISGTAVAADDFTARLAEASQGGAAVARASPSAARSPAGRVDAATPTAPAPPAPHAAADGLAGAARSAGEGRGGRPSDGSAVEANANANADANANANADASGDASATDVTAVATPDATAIAMASITERPGTRRVGGAARIVPATPGDRAAAIPTARGMRLATPVAGISAAGTGQGGEPASEDSLRSQPAAGTAALDAGTSSDAIGLATGVPMLAAPPGPTGSATDAAAGAQTTGAPGAVSPGGAQTGAAALLAGLERTLSTLADPATAGVSGAGARRSADGGDGAGPTPTPASASNDGGASVQAGPGAGSGSGAEAVQAANRTPATVATPAPAAVHAAVGSPQWPDELAAHLMQLSTHGTQSAELRLTPADLGPLQVSIDVKNGAASVWFQAAHPQTRAALEAALPQLRDMLASQGLMLADAGVNRGPPRDAPAPRAAVGTASPAPVAAVSAPAAQAIRLGLVDAYA